LSDWNFFQHIGLQAVAQYSTKQFWVKSELSDPFI